MNASEQIDKQIAEIPGWRGELMARLRAVIHQAAPDIVEEWKWNTGVWSQSGMVCSLGAFKDHVKVNFFKGASLEDPDGLFNAGLEAKATRAIDLLEGAALDERAFIDLVKRAVDYNLAGRK